MVSDAKQKDTQKRNIFLNIKWETLSGHPNILRFISELQFSRNSDILAMLFQFDKNSKNSIAFLSVYK